MPEDHAWDRIVDAIEAKFGLKDHGRHTRAVADAKDLTEHVSFVVFERAGERFKLERVVGPAIIDRKTIGARRAGASVQYVNVYDPDETSMRTNLFREDGGEWTQIDPSQLGL
jgi:hypothetical protein